MIRPKSKKQRGFTLLEVIVGMVLFSFTALGLTSLILQNQFQAQASLRQQAATTFALGVIENLVARSNNQLISGSVSITLHDGTDLTLDDDVWASSTFELMGTPGKPQDDMPISS